ncbi:MAG TPA: hypothetical protein VLK27_12960 [Chthoniobacterales bacterium]|nr:hypothetical protein [Chthoniobacterales bacterium]
MVGERLNQRSLDVRQSCRDRQTTTIALWLNVVCLDAPLVAVTWQWFFAKNFRVALPVVSAVTLFLSAWLIYLIDRLVDAHSLPRDSAKTVREAFCLRHKNVWLGLILVIALVDTAFVFWRLDHDVFVAGIFLGAIAVVYLAVNFAANKLWAAIPLKEIAVGFLFAAGTLLALAPNLSVAMSTITGRTFALAAFIFACLCALNCMSIAVWERGLDRMQGKHSIATYWPRAEIFVQILFAILVVASFFLGILKPPLWPLSSCFALSAVLLIALHFVPVSRDERTALADLVLLTPLAWLLAGKVV